MAITANNALLADVQAVATGQVSGSEVIFAIPRNTLLSLTAKPTSAGTARLMASVERKDTTPTAYTEFVNDSGDKTTEFSTHGGPGVSYLGLQIDSGTWDLRIAVVKSKEFAE